MPANIRYEPGNNGFSYRRLLHPDGYGLVGRNILRFCYNEDAIEGYVSDWEWPRGEGWITRRYFIYRRGEPKRVSSSSRVRAMKKSRGKTTSPAMPITGACKDIFGDERRDRA